MKILEKLLSSKIIDTKEVPWDELALQLQQCFVSTNREIFFKTLKIHMKMITFPNSSCEGFLSLLKGTLVLLNHVSHKQRVMLCLKLITSTLALVIPHLLLNQNEVEAIVSTFIEVLGFENKSIFDLLAFVDPESKWLKCFCYGSHIRETFFRKLTDTELSKFVMDSYCQKPHYDEFLSKFLAYNKDVCSETTLMKHNLSIEVFLKQPELVTPKILDILIDPLVDQKDIILLITKLAMARNSDIIFTNFSHPRKGRHRTWSHLPQKIVDLTIHSLKSDDPLSLDLLNCTLKIFESHPISLIQINSTKLIQLLYESYDKYPREISSIFLFFYTNLPTMVIEEKIVLELFNFYSFSEMRTVLARFPTKNPNFVRTHLEQLWSFDDIFENPVLGEFLFLLFVVKTNGKCIMDLLCDDDDVTVVVDANEKSVTFGDLIEKNLKFNGDFDEEYLALLVLKICCINADLLLYFQANYQMQEKLIKIDNNEVIIDAPTSLRKRFLFSLKNVGFLQSLPKKEAADEFKRFLLNESVSNEYSWLVQARRLFHSSISFDPEILSLLLEKIPKTYLYRKKELQWPPDDSVYYQLHPEDFCGITVVIEFGIKSSLLKSDEKHSDNLSLLLKQSRTFIGHKPQTFSNFDWFVGVIFLITGGDLVQSRLILINFTNVQVVALVWATFGQEFDDTFREHFYQHLSVVLDENCICFQALKILSTAPDVLVSSWLNQCFFNYLKFEEVFNFLIFSILFPDEWLVFYMSAIFQHLNDRICTVTNFMTVENIFEMTNLSDFRLRDYFNFIEKLAKRYRNVHKF